MSTKIEFLIINDKWQNPNPWISLKNTHFEACISEAIKDMTILSFRRNLQGASEGEPVRGAFEKESLSGSLSGGAIEGEPLRGRA